MDVASNAERRKVQASDPAVATRRTSYLSQFKAIFADQREGKKRIHETAQVAQGMLSELYQTVVPVAAKLGENVVDCMVEMRQMQYRSVVEQLVQEQKQPPSSSSHGKSHSIHSRIPINKSASLRRDNFSPGAATLGQQHTTTVSPQTQLQPQKISVITNETPPLTSSTRRSSRLPLYNARRTPNNSNSKNSYPPFCGSHSLTDR